MTPPSAAAHSRQRVRRGAAPRTPRRVSGPAPRPRAGAVAAPAGGALTLPRIALPKALRRLPDGRLVDRLLTGRLWIGFVAFALIGIVFMQVSLLKLNAGIGHSVEQAQSLERVNADLRAEVSQLGSNDRIQQVAERLGLELPPPGAVTFLGKDGRRMGGDGVTALAVGTQTGPAAAGTAAGATVPGTAAAAAQTGPGATTPTTPGATATTAAAPAPGATAAPAKPAPTGTAPVPQPQPQPQPTPQAPAPAPTTAAGGATAPTG